MRALAWVRPYLPQWDETPDYTDRGEAPRSLSGYALGLLGDGPGSPDRGGKRGSANVINEREIANGQTTWTPPGEPVAAGDTGIRPAVEVPAKAVRRQFTSAYKLSILEQAEACAPRELGALLRREGLYSSHLTKWRQQRAAGRLEPKRRSPKAERDAALRRVADLERENRRLRQGLQRAETIIAVQKNSACSGTCRPPTGTARADGRRDRAGDEH